MKKNEAHICFAVCKVWDKEYNRHKYDKTENCIRCGTSKKDVKKGY